MPDYSYVHVPTCESAVKDESIFNVFKRDKDFNTILEHTQDEYSHVFMSQILNKYSNYIQDINWELIKENDLLGDPYKIEYQELSKVVTLDNYIMAPSTVAYTFKALDILSHMKKSSLDDIRIVEIGAGYGGQCKILLDLAPIFNINIKSYTLIDLYWPNELQKKYLKKLGYIDKVKFISYESLVDNNRKMPAFDYLISVYALGEFSKDIQQFYIDKLKDLQYYYVVWNTPSIHEYFLLADIENEVPKTGPANVVIKSKVNK